MNIQKQNNFKRLIQRKLYGLIWKIDNTGDSDYTRSGERAFLKNIASNYRNKIITVFDVGANMGEYTEMLQHELPQSHDASYHLFEPQKSCHTSLREKFEDNPNVVINNFGLSDQSKTINLYKDKDGSGFASIYKQNLKHYNIDFSDHETVIMKPADEYITSKAIKHINLLKIDVEGHELSVLKGFGKYLHPDYIDFIQFEYGGANLDSKSSLLELFSVLTEAGFVMTKMMRHHIELRQYTPELENFMYQNWVAVAPKFIP